MFKNVTIILNQMRQNVEFATLAFYTQKVVVMMLSKQRIYHLEKVVGKTE